MKQNINRIVNYLHEQRGYDSTGSRFSKYPKQFSTKQNPAKLNNVKEHIEKIPITDKLHSSQKRNNQDLPSATLSSKSGKGKKE